MPDFCFKGDIFFIMANKRILGLDASTKTIGLSIIDEIDGYMTLSHLEHFHPPKDGDIFERLAIVRKFIIDKIDEFKPTDIALEDIILFMKNKSSAQTIRALAILNRTVGLAIYNYTGKSPNLLSVMKVRHAIKLTNVFPSKDDIPELVAKILNIKFPYILDKDGSYAVHKRGKNKGKYIEQNFDRADSIAVAIAFIKVQQQIEQKHLKLEQKKLKGKKKDGLK
jgi:Holliday junction resolvasome RuvABC endonuclease subunit